MLLKSAKIKNFRLLAEVELVLEEKSTVVVGRNNSGKTSLSEVMRRFLKEGTPRFHLEDFSSACYDQFCAALDAFHAGEEEGAVRQKLPTIELRLVCSYDPNNLSLGPLAPFVIDLEPNSSTAIAILSYELEDGGIKALFAETPTPPLTAQTRLAYFKLLRDRILKHFKMNIWAEDPNDPTNKREIAVAALRHLVKTGFINAQRGLDDVTTRESDILATILEGLFTNATSPNADQSDKVIVEALTTAIEGIQREIDGNFVTQLKKLMPALQTFGYPGLGGQELQTETTLEVGRLLSNFTKVRYEGYGGVALPESYNGLGARNLIFKVSYQEIKNLRRYLAGFSPFETKHGVKGDQFENVIVVIGRGWNHYNFGEMLEFAGGKPIPAKKAEGFERNRNLFYVACSRAQKRLALLFTQQLSTDAIKTLTNWFGTDALVELEVAG